MTADVLVVGAGPAGLTAALVLARAGRDTVVVDAGEGRNAPAAHAHNVFTRDGTPPSELRAIGRRQAEAYGARFIEARADHADAHENGVRVRLADGRVIEARRLLLATGVVDELPDLPGLRAAWGRTAVHCPYCHGYELRGRPTAVLGRGTLGFELARLLTGWTSRITLLTDGPSGLTDEEQAGLAAREISVREDALDRLEVDGDQVRAVVFRSGTSLDATAVYLKPSQHLSSPLPDALGLARTETGLLTVDAAARTSVPVVYACGDAVTPMQMVQVAAASGASTAALLNHDLVAGGHV